jgi:fatty-acyl-CoA synthase
MQWNLADIFDAVARVVPADRPAIIHGSVTIDWGELDRRSNRVARGLLALGLAPGARVGFLSRNHAAYIEGFIACLKARLVHVNINYRYLADEIAYVLEDSGASALLFQQEFSEVTAALRVRLPAIGHWICADGPATAPATVAFEDLARTGDGSALDIPRSGEDAFLLYTGGTTGRPKGVLWPADSVRRSQLESPAVSRVPQTLAEHVELVRANPAPGRVLPACPLMHGAGITSSLAELLSGGTAILLPSPSFDAVELWQQAALHRATRILIVGDVFARPMLRALDEAEQPFDLAALKLISSSGLMWSHEAKTALLQHLPGITLMDILGASEASGLGYAVTRHGDTTPTGRFTPGPKTVLLADDGRILGPGEPGEGLIARSAPLPIGYLNDAAKTAEVFRVVAGVRYAVPGDWARRHADGTMALAGRGSLVVNTGGEKVFIEEVEEALKRVPGIDDAMVVGLPDPQWGAVVTALVSWRRDAPLDARAVRAAVVAQLAGYKAPRLIFAVDAMPRSVSGKGDYRRAKEMAALCREEADDVALTRPT